MICSEWDCTQPAYMISRGHALCEDHYEAEYAMWGRALAGGPARTTS